MRMFIISAICVFSFGGCAIYRIPTQYYQIPIGGLMPPLPPLSQPSFNTDEVCATNRIDDGGMAEYSAALEIAGRQPLQ